MIRDDPVTNVSVAEVVGAVTVTLFIVDVVVKVPVTVVLPVKPMVAFVWPIAIGVTPVPVVAILIPPVVIAFAILIDPVVSPAPIAMLPVVTVTSGNNDAVAVVLPAFIVVIVGVVNVGDELITSVPAVLGKTIDVFVPAVAGATTID